MPGVGIDFGTTNSLVVAFDKKTNKFTYFNYDGENAIPTSSTVWYHDNKVVVGVDARSAIHRFSEVEGHHFEKSIKLHLGTDYLSDIFGRATTPSDIAAEIISNLKRNAIDVYKADKAGVDLKRAVFTVPINFSGKARRDLRKAANKAGIEVTTFIHEPFAAIVGYYFTKDGYSNTDIINELNALEGHYSIVSACRQSHFTEQSVKWL